jgi:hypothetical protein
MLSLMIVMTAKRRKRRFRLDLELFAGTCYLKYHITDIEYPVSIEFCYIMLQVNLLGTPTLTLNDEPIEISRRKALALFLYLVTTQRPHARNHLCVLLWSYNDSDHARAELRRMLSALNKTPLAAYIEADRQNVRLINTDDMRVDLWELEAVLNAGDWQGFLDHMDA